MAWDRTKPPAGPGSPLTSADIRGNWDALAQAVGDVNCVADPTFLIWAAGDAAAPTHWALSGAGAAVARSGTGLGDTVRKVGKFAAKVTAGGGATAILGQDLLTTTSYDDYLDGLVVSLGAWVRCSAATSARVGIFDGVGTSYSDYAPGTSVFTWLGATRTLDASATRLTVRFEVAASQTGYLSGPTGVLGPVVPLYFKPCPMVNEHLRFHVAGNLSTGTNIQGGEDSYRPAIVEDVHLSVKTAPATQAVIVDVNSWDGAAYTSMFSTRPQIAAAATRGSARPDTTYARRCLSFHSGSATPAAGGGLSFDIDQVGSGTVGADLTVHVRVKRYQRPLETFLGYNEIS
jgi:hypothetical protein